MPFTISSHKVHVKYRFGAFYSKPYYKIKDSRAANEYGITAGFGLPLPRTRSMLVLGVSAVVSKGYRPLAMVKDQLKPELLRDKKAEKIMAMMKSSGATTLARYKALPNAVSDTVKHAVRFSIGRFFLSYINGFCSNYFH